MTNAPVVFYVETPADRVAPEVRAAAAIGVGLAVSDLDELRGMTVRVRWFRVGLSQTADDFMAGLATLDSEQRIDGRTGGADPDTIWLSATMDSGRAAIVAAHECVHLAQRIAWGPPDTVGQREDRERMAQDYAASWAGLVSAFAISPEGAAP